VWHLRTAPLPLDGEGSGGGADSAAFPPHPNLPPPRGEGVLTDPRQPSMGEDTGGSCLARRQRARQSSYGTTAQHPGAHPPCPFDYGVLSRLRYNKPTTGRGVLEAPVVGNV
jgi:hypothetical protein